MSKRVTEAIPADVDWNDPADYAGAHWKRGAKVEADYRRGVDADYAEADSKRGVNVEADYTEAD